MIELRGQSFIMCEHERRAVQLLDNFGHREGLAGAGDTEQYLVLLAFVETARKIGNGRLLVTLRTVGKPPAGRP